MQVAHLKHKETIRVDTDKLNDICHAMGTPSGEAAVHCVMEDLAQSLQHIDDIWHGRAGGRLGHSARRTAQLADQIGLLTLASVARVVADLDGRRDDAALAANVRRMIRLGEGSLIAIWEAQDVSL